MKTTKHNARPITVTKHGQDGRVIAQATVATLEAAHAFLDGLNPDGTHKAAKPVPYNMERDIRAIEDARERADEPDAPRGTDAEIIADLKQATPCQQQQAGPRVIHADTIAAGLARAEKLYAAEDAAARKQEPGVYDCRFCATCHPAAVEIKERIAELERGIKALADAASLAECASTYRSMHTRVHHVAVAARKLITVQS